MASNTWIRLEEKALNTHDCIERFYRIALKNTIHNEFNTQRKLKEQNL